MTSPTSGRNAQTDTGVPRAGGAEGIDGQHPLLRCSARAEQGSRWVVVRKTGGAGQRGGGGVRGGGERACGRRASGDVESAEGGSASRLATRRAAVEAQELDWAGCRGRRV
jgi:hypothetical protein